MCTLQKWSRFHQLYLVTLKKTFNIVNAILLVALVAMGVLKNKILPVIFLVSKAESSGKHLKDTVSITYIIS